tara:strand:- start:2445 stop:2891 length:447 start_codon:yes stop_codon:yes gene_type:complete
LVTETPDQLFYNTLRMMQILRHQLGSGIRGITICSLLFLGGNFALGEEPAPERKRQVIPRITNPSFGKVITSSGRVSVRSISTRSPINTSHPSIVSAITVGDQTIVIPKEEKAGADKAEAKEEVEVAKPEKPLNPVSGNVRRAYAGDY